MHPIDIGAYFPSLFLRKQPVHSVNGVNNIRVHPVNEHELLRDIPAHEENGDEVFSSPFPRCSTTGYIIITFYIYAGYKILTS